MRTIAIQTAAINPPIRARQHEVTHGVARAARDLQPHASTVPLLQMTPLHFDNPVLQRKGACACGGGCPRCERNLPLQAKLAVSEPGDLYEQEADRVADKVIQTSVPSHNHQYAGFTKLPNAVVQRKCNQCAEDEEVIQKKEATDHPAASRGSVPASAIIEETLRSPGQQLDANTRVFMESRLGHDLSQVRVHTDARAAESARAVNAQAYTVGSHITFAERQYDPAGGQGLRLLAHELTHVIQQGGSRGGHVAGSMDATSNSDTLSSGIRLQRKPQEEDPTHDALIEDFRRRQGLPPGGLDESGKPVGPTDAEIKYLLFPVRKQTCPEVRDFKTTAGARRALCATAAMKKEPADCHFTDKQKKLLRDAKVEAASRVRRALERVQAGKEGEGFATELAGRLFLYAPPSVAEVKEVLGRVSAFLSGSGVEFVAKGCGEPTCNSSATVAYVTAAGTMPIYICPLAFAAPETLHRTVLHEALHWSGLDADPTTPEGYCEKFDCMTACLGKEDADAWSHYIDCLGMPLETRRSFRDKIVESVDQIP